MTYLPPQNDQNSNGSEQPDTPRYSTDAGYQSYEQPHGQHYQQYQPYDQPAYGQQPYGQQYGQYGQQPYGYQYDPYAYPQPYYGAQKSKIAAGLFGIFLGVFGVHNFYLGRTGPAVAQLLITILSFGILAWISAIWGLIEGILILAGSGNYRYDGRGVPLRD